MRTQIELQNDWWVSVSEKDARLAAGQARWKAADSELAADKENHPQKIALPGGWHNGKRPLAAVSTPPDAKAKADPNFVGGGDAAVPAARRLSRRLVRRSPRRDEVKATTARTKASQAFSLRRLGLEGNLLIFPEPASSRRSAPYQDIQRIRHLAVTDRQRAEMGPFARRTNQPAHH